MILSRVFIFAVLLATFSKTFFLHYRQKMLEDCTGRLHGMVERPMLDLVEIAFSTQIKTMTASLEKFRMNLTAAIEAKAIVIEEEAAAPAAAAVERNVKKSDPKAGHARK